MAEQLIIKTRFEFGEKRTVLNPGDVVDLPDKKYGLTKNDVERILKREAGVLNKKAKLTKSLKTKED